MPLSKEKTIREVNNRERSVPTFFLGLYLEYYMVLMLYLSENF